MRNNWSSPGLWRSEAPVYCTSDRDLDILATILGTSLVRCTTGAAAGGNEDVTHKNCAVCGSGNWQIAGPYPDSGAIANFNRASLNLLAERRGLEIQAEMLGGVRKNREKDYANAAVRGQHMQLGFLQHSVGRDRIMCRIDPALHDSAVQRKGWRTVVMKGRHYRGYVHVDADALRDQRDLDYWIGLSLDYNGRAKASPSKKR